MARKIFKGVGKALGITKKKKPAPAAPSETSAAFTPVVKQLAPNDLKYKNRVPLSSFQTVGSVLGGYGKLGG